MNAVNIVAQKYFAGTPGSPEREFSLRQLIDRVVNTITTYGFQNGYFDDKKESKAFSEELKYILASQRASFNSPVWFNIGAEGRKQQASACFILGIEDDMKSILNWYVEEGVIFKGGSGSGINLSAIRSSSEYLSASGGKASGPVSFMRGADASAGTIKSGGKTRRAAKMVILNADHPDIEEFIWCKAIEERKARVLQEAGFDMDLDGKDSFSVQYQNANNSVRVTDDFMKAVEKDRPLEGGEFPGALVRLGELLEEFGSDLQETALSLRRGHRRHLRDRFPGERPDLAGPAPELGVFPEHRADDRPALRGAAVLHRVLQGVDEEQVPEIRVHGISCPG